MQCHVGLYFLSNSFLMNAAMSCREASGKQSKLLACARCSNSNSALSRPLRQAGTDQSTRCGVCAPFLCCTFRVPVTHSPRHLAACLLTCQRS
eukprot:20214-Heterococcus_DN1.PRE.2